MTAIPLLVLRSFFCLSKLKAANQRYYYFCTYSQYCLCCFGLVKNTAVKFIMKWIEKYSGILRRMRFTYWLFNLSKLDKLNKNKQLYKELGVDKPVWKDIAHADIKQKSADIPWMDKPGITTDDIKSHPQFATFSTVVQEQLLQWPNNGYMIIPALMPQEADEINSDINTLKQHSKVGFNFTGRKIMDAWQHSQAINKAFHNPVVTSVLEFIFQKKIIPFQTINFIYGSEQKPHSDSIHMTTEPLGYLSAMWLALEDVKAGSGELVYYPGSHKLNYIMSEDYNTGNNALQLGDNTYQNYEQKIEDVIKQHQFVPHTFMAKKGDVLIWHANLLHGGCAITDVALTRKSMVAHYYAEGVLQYHEISQRPAIIKAKS